MANPAKKLLSDEELGALEGAPAPKKLLSDEELAAMESPSDRRANSRPLDLVKEFNRTGEKMRAPEGVMDAVRGATGTIDRVTGGNLRYFGPTKGLLEESERESPTSFKAGSAAGEVGKGVGMAFLPGGLPAQVLAGSALGFFEKPEGTIDISEDLAARAKNAGTAGAATLTLGAGGKILGKAGDYAMQKAVGAKELIPGMGTRIANEGLIGTKGMMRRQIERPEGVEPGLMGKITDFMGLTNKLPAREKALQAQIPKMKGQISSNPSVDAISSEGSKLVPRNPAIPISSGNQAAVEAAEKRALEAGSRGNLSPDDALDVARKIDRAAYDNAIPSGRFAKKLDRADSGAIRGELKNQADKQGLPKVRELLGREQALISARQSLESPEPMMNQLFRVGLGAGLGGGATYYATENPYASLLAAGAMTPAGLSTIGQLGTKGSQAIPYLTPATISALVQRAREEE